MVLVPLYQSWQRKTTGDDVCARTRDPRGDGGSACAVVGRLYGVAVGAAVGRHWAAAAVLVRFQSQLRW